MLAPDVDDHVAVAVQPARRVGVDVALVPGLAVPRLPHERRVLGVDADALDLALHPQTDRAPGHGVAQADHQRVVGLRAVEAKAANLEARRNSSVLSTRSSEPAACVAMDASEQGTRSRSSTVEKTIAFSVSVRTVAVFVLTGDSLRGTRGARRARTSAASAPESAGTGARR